METSLEKSISTLEDRVLNITKKQTPLDSLKKINISMLVFGGLFVLILVLLMVLKPSFITYTPVGMNLTTDRYIDYSKVFTVSTLITVLLYIGYRFYIHKNPSTIFKLP